MTTKLIIKNAACSNGDAHLRLKCGAQVVNSTLTPGQSSELWVATAHKLGITETWPTATPASEQAKAGETADNFIATEVAIQDKMWGDANERADAKGNQMMHAANAQLSLLLAKFDLASRIAMAEDPTKPFSDEFKAERYQGLVDSIQHEHYPSDWNGFRDYGSNVANLVVAAAFIRSEIKRRILLGEDTTRAKRGEAYKGPDFPYVSSEEAAKSAN